MHLERLEIHGFKSFAKKSELTFPATTTAIVGPNGSGKSNVAEALRFVLGEQSVKSMRGKRGEDMIWGGSESVGRSNRASVRVVINNAQRTLPMDSDSITIGRVVHRDGQNEYLLNEKAVRLKDVHELLAAGNIGPSGHHIISQGEADRVLAATPMERRAMIEEALGLKVYQFKKQDAEKKLHKTQQNLHEVHALRKELAPHLNYLKREIEKQEEADALRKDLHTSYAEYLYREDRYLAYHTDRLQREIAALRDEVTNTENAVQKLEESDSAKTNDETDTSEHETKLRDAVSEARRARDELAQKKSAATARLGVLSEQIEALTHAADTEVTISENAAREIVAKIDEEVAHAQSVSDVEALQATVQRMQTHVHQFAETLREDEVTQEKITQLRKEYGTLEKEVHELEVQVKEAQSTEESTHAELTEWRTAQQQAAKAAQDATKELYEKKTQLSERQADLRRLEHEHELIERERQLFKDDLQEAVALLGRGAAEYFNHELTDAEGNSVPPDTVIEEDRAKQRERKRALEKQKIRLETLGESASEEITKEYHDTKERDDFLAREVNDLEHSVTTLRALIADLDSQINDEFQNGFVQINREFQNFFTLMFGGGTATLEELSVATAEEEEEKNVAKGVDLQVNLPNKRIQGLAMLSGGERALTSIALIFAMSQVHPPLFVVLDETDAALDEANSRRYGDLIEALAERSQLVLITHNRETMSRAGILYGVTMGESGASKLLSVQLADAVQNVA
jgi:chromosome segregation protein